MPRKKEDDRLPSLSQALAAKKANPKKEVVAPPPEEPKFYGAEFAALIQTGRKMGTLREKDAKRAGLTKGLRIMGHVHPDGQQSSIADIPLVILNVFHGSLYSVLATHRLEFWLDGITTEEEAIRILQNFSRNRIISQTEIDYFTFIKASVFDQLTAENQKRLLDLPIKLALTYPELAKIYYPSLCQTHLWHDGNLRSWLDLLLRMKTIDKVEAEEIYNFPAPDTIGNFLARDMDGDPDYGLQFLLEECNLQDPLYHAAVLADLAAAKAAAKLVFPR